MQPVDVSIHGWPIGPVPIGIGILSLVIFVNIVRGKTKLNRDNTICPIGLAPLIVVLVAYVIGIHDRADLSLNVVFVAGVAGTVLAFLLSAIIHRKAGIPIWGKWILFKDLRTTALLKRLVAALVLPTMFLVPAMIFGSEFFTYTECSTALCVATSIAAGSNLSALGILWMLTFLFSFFAMAWALTAKELANRLLSAILKKEL